MNGYSSAFEQGMKNETGYGRLLGNSRFQAFLWTQFLAAFNDNVYKMIVSVFALEAVAGHDQSSRYLALAGVVFVVPFLLFAGTAGQLADRFSKTRVLQATKAFEMLIMLLGIFALLSGRIEGLLVVLFLLATQANFFSPAKYGILPEMLPEAQLSRANGLLELTTYIAIVVGSSFGGFLYDHWKALPLRMGGTLLGLAVVGSLTSLHIPKVRAAGSTEPFHWNPFTEIIAGCRELWRSKPLLMSVIGISWFWFVGALFQMALLLTGKEVLHVSETQSGLLITALAAGIGIGSVLAGAISGDHIELGLVPFGAGLMGLFSIALGLTSNYNLALAALVGIGFSGGLFVVPLNAFLQDESGAKEKGRLQATNNFINMAGMILAYAILWILHDLMHWRADGIVLALGLAMLAGGAYTVFLLPDRSFRFVLWCLATCLFRIRVDGAQRIPRQGGALLVSNHVSLADAVFVGYATPRLVRFLMWKPFFDIPIGGSLCRIMHSIPIPTGAPQASMRALVTARRELEAGELVGIFPEGGITKSGSVEKFERGFERIVNGGKSPIIPMRLEGMWGHPLTYKGGGAFKSWENLWRPRVVIHIGEPIFEAVSSSELQQIIAALPGAPVADTVAVQR
jgi:acyl-[acyl-carrier-protein]-phospholipid O-acyltransferase/long-chain-fatty-acid--[acyl-carrier-protein] ligase